MSNPTNTAPERLTGDARREVLKLLDPDLTDVHDNYTIFKMAAVRIKRLQAHNEAKVEAQEYAITLDIERDQDVIDMYLERLAGGIANPGAEARVESLRDKIARREAQRALLSGN